MTRRIIQFGTSRFLQAHVDLFVHQARLSGQSIGPITVVKTTSGHDRAGRIAALKRGRPFPIYVRGIENGRVIDETIEVASVDQAFDAQQEWPAVVRCFASEADIAVSNVSDRGYDSPDKDAGHDFSSLTPPHSFPAKLLVLLLARFRESGRPLLFLPTELVSSNGRRLAEVVAKLAVASCQPDAFRAWLAQSVRFVDTLVDRIVSEPIEPVGAVAEPYALWAIRRGGFREPFRHAAVRLVDDLEPVERLKIHILNLGPCLPIDGEKRAARAARACGRSSICPPSPTSSPRSMPRRSCPVSCSKGWAPRQSATSPRRSSGFAIRFWSIGSPTLPRTMRPSSGIASLPSWIGFASSIPVFPRRA